MIFLSSQVEITVGYNKLKSELERAKNLSVKMVNKIERSFKGIPTTTKEVFNKMTNYAKSASLKIGNTFKSAFSKMANFGVAGFNKILRYGKYALLAIGALAIKSFATFDNAMQESVSIMSDVTPKLRKEMEKLAETISLESTTSATELARSYFYLASAGLSAKQSIAALSAVEDFAVAGAFDMAKATDLITDSQSALGLTVEDSQQNLKNMKRISDALIGANTLANASTEQFSIALMRAGPAMKAYNIKLEEGVAMLAAYADQGKKAEVGGELFGRMLRLMISGFNKNKAAWDRFGISIVDANDKMRPMADIVRELTDLLEPMGVTQKAATLEMLGFKAISQQTIMPLIGMGDAIERYNNELHNMEGVTRRIKDEQLKSFSKQMKIVWNNIVSIAIAIGEHLAPHIQRMGDWIRANRDTIEKWAVSFTDYVLLVKDYVWAFVKFLSSDWKAGIQTGLDISIELFKAFGESLVLILTDVGMRVADAFIKVFGKKIGAYLMELGEKLTGTPILGMMPGLTGIGHLGAEIFEAGVKSENAPPKERSSLGANLKSIWQETGKKLQEMIPPEATVAFEEESEKLKKRLEEIGASADEAGENIDAALNPDPEKIKSRLEEIKGIFAKTKETLSQWYTSATDIGTNLGNSLVSAFDNASDALAEFVVKGKADFTALADSIIMDLARMATRALMAQAFGGLFSAFGIPLGGGAAGVAGTQFNPFYTVPAGASGQEGGEVTRTGFAYIHKGEILSGVENGRAKSMQQKQVNLNINVTAIDAAGSYQFLERNKKSIANLINNELTSNNKLRRNPNKWK